MPPEILTMEQGTDEWHAARLGIPTASSFSAILASGRGGSPSKTRQTYLYKLAGERLTGQPAENFTTPAMERGHALEAEARALYEFSEGGTVEQVGFMRNHRAGASPDGLVGDDGLLEIKTCAAHILIGHIEANRPPPEHAAQVAGQMWVAERAWCDLYLYCPGLPPFRSRITRDDEYIDNVLAPGVQRFNDDLDALVARLTGDSGKHMGRYPT